MQIIRVEAASNRHYRIDINYYRQYNKCVRITFDAAKNERNIRLRGLSFERVADVDLAAALVFADTRRAYGETRYVALCHLDERLHVLCFTGNEQELRVISFRKANAREVKRYGKAKEAGRPGR